MRKFAIKSFIFVVITISILFLNLIKSYAQINLKILSQVAKNCQEDTVSSKYYEQMGLNNIQYNYELFIQECISQRYHYSLVISKFPWLVSSGYILPEYPASVVVGKLTYGFSGYYPTHILDCIANDDPTSKECSFTRKHIAFGTKIREAYNLDISTFKATYIYVCPSCVVAHDELSGSETKILNAFTQWFLTLDKPQRRELMSLLGDEENASVRWSLKQESDEAVKEYLEARTRVEQQERERRRRELLGQ